MATWPQLRYSQLLMRKRCHPFPYYAAGEDGDKLQTGGERVCKNNRSGSLLADDGLENSA